MIGGEIYRCHILISQKIAGNQGRKLGLDRLANIFRNCFWKFFTRATMADRLPRENAMDDGEFDASLDDQCHGISELDVAVDSPAIRRLIEEVRAETVDVPRSYNRTFNRHNR
jgi:hypothetical protein